MLTDESWAQEIIDKLGCVGSGHALNTEEDRRRKMAVLLPLYHSLDRCVRALYDAIKRAPINNLPEYAGEAIQEAQAILGR